jgi:lactate permease
MWNQVYDPFNDAMLSTLVAALPVITLLALIASNKVKAPIAAVIALLVAIAVAVFAFTMPAGLAIRAVVLGAVTGFFPIGWIILNVLFLYRLTVERGVFETLQTTIGGVTADRHLQLLAFSFGAFFEGASGFGTPVAVTVAVLIGLGFSPLAASGLSLIANTAPVAYGALGTPIAGLASVTGIDSYVLGAMVGRQLPFFSLIVPFWLIWVFAGFRGMLQVWPAILVTSVSFAVPQFLISNFINPWIVDIGASPISMACLILFLKVWTPLEIWTSPALRSRDDSAKSVLPPTLPCTEKPTTARVWLSLMPWIIVCAVLPKPTPEAAVFSFTWLTYTGSGMLIAAIISGVLMGFGPLRLVTAYARTIRVTL